MKGLFTVILILFSFNNLFSQSYSYTYVDPCTKKIKSLTIPNGQNSITVNYYGAVSQFNGNDFNNGVFSAWINSVAAANSSQPCGEVVTQLTSNVNMIVTQNIVSTVMNVTSIANMAQSMSAMSNMSSGLGNSVNNSESGSSGGNSGSKKDKNNGKNDVGNNSNSSSSNNSGNSSGNTNTTSNNQTQGQGSQISSNNGTSSQSAGSNGNSSGNGSAVNGNGNNAGSGNGNGQANSSGSGQPTEGNVSSGSGTQANSGNQGNSTGGSSPTNNTGSSSGSGSTTQSSNSTGGSSTTAGSNSSTGGSSSTQGGSTGGNSGGSSSTGSNGSGSNGTGSGTGTGNGTSTPPGSGDNTSTAKSGNGSTGGISNSISNSEDNSGSGGSGSGGSKNGGSRTRTGSLIGSGDVVALKSAEDPSAKNQFKFTGSLTHANTKNTKVSGLLGNYTTEIRNLNLTLYKAWVIPESQWTIIAANSSMLNFEKDFFNTTTVLASKRFKGNWKKLTVMSGLNYTAGNLGETKFGNLSAVGGGFYSYNLGKKVSGSILCLAVYSPFTQFFEGQWWQSGTLLVPFNSWDYSITKTFKFNISISGVYELNSRFLNYQVLTGGKILL